jgi:hypothetical protein
MAASSREESRDHLYGVVMQAEMDSMPEAVRLCLLSALRLQQPFWWETVPGLLCVVTSMVNPSMLVNPESWSKIHGRLNADLARFESEFLPFVLDRAECSAIRVHQMWGGVKPGTYVMERWTWWPGSSLEEVVEGVTARAVMES